MKRTAFKRQAPTPRPAKQIGEGYTLRPRAVARTWVFAELLLCGDTFAMAGRSADAARAVGEAIAAVRGQGVSCAQSVGAMKTGVATLPDGREVSTSSEEWRHICEARAIMRLPTTHDRRAWLDDIERKRGADSRRALEDTIRALWPSR